MYDDMAAIRDMGWLFDRTKIIGFRSTVRRHADGLIEALFYTIRGGRKIDFGTVAFTEALYCCEGRAGMVQFRIASIGGAPRYDAPLIILAPGLAGRWTSMVLLHATLLRAGFNVLYFDSRGHGENVGLEPSFGYFEADDILSMIAFVHDVSPYRGGTKRMGIFGSSVGAAAALRVACLQPEIRAVAVEGTYSNPLSAFEALNQRQAALAKRLLVSNPDKLSSVSPIEISGQFPAIPIRMIWGEKDLLVSPEDRQEMVRAFRGTAAEVEIEFVESAPHTIQMGFPLSDDQVHSYMARIANYFSMNL